jgi:acetyl-CoA carboxylase carboxyl transferase subunit beta
MSNSPEKHDTKFLTRTIPGVEGKEPTVTPLSSASDQMMLKKPRPVTGGPRKRVIPEGLWTKCPKCNEMIYDKELETKLNVCFSCGHHFALTARERIHSLVEADTFEQMDENMSSVDVLEFPGYMSKIAANQQKTGLKDAVITGLGSLNHHRIALGVMDFSFNGGSMGSVVGEKLTRAIEKGTELGLPVIICSTSGGARMYEGMFSLMQMAKTCGALAYHGKQGLPFISVLTDPTMAGVMASFASVGDLIVAEPAARIGFAGPRVIKDTTKADLPEGFQTAEFLCDHGLVDAIIHRKDLKTRLSYYLDFLMVGKKGKGKAKAG